MAKKRKASSRHAEVSNGPNLDVGSSKKRIRDFEDVADSDDEFHLNRDKVLLDEGPDAKRRRKRQEQEEFLQPSDEEVLGQSEGESENDVADGRFEQDRVDSASDRSDAEEEDEEHDLRWGTGRDDIYGADEIETEEQALEEEAEALRLQKKQLESMTAADYGFDEAEWQGGAEDGNASEQDHRNVVTEVLPQLQIADDMTPTERLKLLKSRYPEFEPLSEELLAVRKHHTALLEGLGIQGNSFDREDLPNLRTKIQAASAYLGALAMYFTLLSSSASTDGTNAVAMSASQLRDHPIMDTLMKCKELWSQAQKLPDDIRPLKPNKSMATPIGADVASNDDAVTEHRSVAQRSTKKSRAQKHAEAAQAATEARKAERMQRTEADLANLDSLVAQSRKRKSEKSRHLPGYEDPDDGEEVPLTAQEAAEKAKRKKSLRFYTSQIAQKANKRGAASRNAGGDDDIPHRERLRDRQARLNAEAEKRGRKAVDARAELGGESDEEDAWQIQEFKAGANDEDYYDLVAARTARKKADKVAFADARKQAEMQGGRIVPEETVGADGKRKITYAIEKNKGLTPHRKKEDRNPRVKKRKKFDASKKKLASIKPVYKGGEGRGGYGGELTGIKSSLVKSTKL